MVVLFTLLGIATPAAAQAAASRSAQATAQVSVRLDIPSRVRLREVSPLRRLPARGDTTAWTVTYAVSANDRWELALRSESGRVAIREGGPCDDLMVEVAVRTVRAAPGRVPPAIRLELTVAP